MTYDFDTVWNREGTNSVKWEFIVRESGIEQWDAANASKGDERILPMWVADMDFAVAPAIAEAIQQRATHSIYGYAQITNSYRDAVRHWQRSRNNWEVEREWIQTVPGIVPAMNLVVRRFTNPGDGVLLQRPVYHPFSHAAENNGREVVSASLQQAADGNYVMDYDDLERKARNPKVKVALLCSPHNPVGRVWTADELGQFADICTRNGVMVFADEIHSDLIMPGEAFMTYANVPAAHQAPFMVATAPSKSFNLAGLKTANMIIPDADLRAEFAAEVRATGLMGVNPFGIVATEAAYRHGHEWLDEANAYIAANLEFMTAYAAEHMPQIRVVKPQGTYLVWLDMRALGYSTEGLGDLLMNKARLYLDEGQIFGPEGEGFARINIACPRTLLELALDQLRSALA